MGGMITAGRDRGFTLVEMLVVLLIMGLFVGLVSSITRPDDRALLRIEAERLAQLLDLATTESRLTGKFIAWTSDGPGYRFWRLQQDGEWSEIPDSAALRARTLPQGMTITDMRVENMRSQGAMRLEFTPSSPVLSFTIEMSFGAARYSVAATPMGEVRVLPNGKKTHDELALR